MFLQLLPHLFLIFAYLLLCIYLISMIIKRMQRDDLFSDLFYLLDYALVAAIVILGGYLVYSEALITNNILLKDQQDNRCKCENR